MKKLFQRAALLTLIASTHATVIAKANDQVKSSESSKKGPKKKEKSMAEVAEEARLGVRRVGTQVGHAVDEFLKKKPAKKDKSAKN